MSSLLEELRRLRQRVEATGVHPARHQVVARAFRRAARQRGRLDLDEALAVEVVARPPWSCDGAASNSTASSGGGGRDSGSVGASSRRRPSHRRSGTAAGRVAFSTFSSRTITSISPVGRFGFSVSAGRSTTSPSAATTYSARTSPARSCVCGARSGLNTSWTTPVRSRRSTNKSAAVVASGVDPAHQRDRPRHVRPAQLTAEMAPYPVAETLAQSAPPVWLGRSARRIADGSSGVSACAWLRMSRSTAVPRASSSSPTINTKRRAELRGPAHVALQALATRLDLQTKPAPAERAREAKRARFGALAERREEEVEFATPPPRRAAREPAARRRARSRRRQPRVRRGSRPSRRSALRRRPRSVRRDPRPRPRTRSGSNSRARAPCADSASTATDSAVEQLADCPEVLGTCLAEMVDHDRRVAGLLGSPPCNRGCAAGSSRGDDCSRRRACR